MPSTEPAGHWTRRDFIGGGALLALALGVPVGALQLTNLDAADAPSDAQRALIREVSQLVIPRTDTAGAGDVGTGDFVILALAHGLSGSRTPVATQEFAGLVRGDGSLRHLALLEQQLDRRAGGGFLAMPQVRRAAVLGALDAEAFAEGADAHPWRTIKGLILTGYYTSEIGGAHELRYVHVPGRWDPDLPLHPGDRALSSDWTAVEFG